MSTNSLCTGYLEEAEGHLRSAMMVGFAVEGSKATDLDLTEIDSRYKAVLRKLDTITYLSQRTRQEAEKHFDGDTKSEVIQAFEGAAASVSAKSGKHKTASL